MNILHWEQGASVNMDFPISMVDANPRKHSIQILFGA